MKSQRIPWPTALSLALLTARSRNTMVEHLGIAFTQLDDYFLRGTMPVDARSCQPMRLLHGGASVAFAETLASVGANCIAEPGMAAVGQEINANHLRPVPEGESVTGTACMLYAGARSQVWSIEICNSADQLTCISRITLALIKQR